MSRKTKIRMKPYIPKNKIFIELSPFCTIDIYSRYNPDLVSIIKKSNIDQTNRRWVDDHWELNYNKYSIDVVEEIANKFNLDFDNIIKNFERDIKIFDCSKFIEIEKERIRKLGY